MKSTERMANLISPLTEHINTSHGIKTQPQLALMIEEQTGIETLAEATEALIELAEYYIKRASSYRGLTNETLANAHAAVQYYRGDTDDED